MNTTDERNLEACVLALSRQKEPLPKELHSRIQAAGNQLAQDESAVYSLREIIEQHSELKRSYEAARSQLQSQYDIRERSKGGAAAIGKVNNGNFVLSLAVPILTADNFSSAAQRLVSRSDWQTQAKGASDDAKTFFQTLKETVTRLDAVSVEVLKVLEQDVFTIENIAYRLDLPEEKVKPVLEDLWQRGYIYPVSGTVTGNIWRSLNIFTQKKGPLDTAGYLSLTAKGYYYLHPHPLFKVFKSIKEK